MKGRGPKADRKVYLAIRDDAPRTREVIRNSFARSGWALSENTEDVEQDVDSLRAADLAFVVLPGARGTHVQLGLAIASGVPAVVWCADAGASLASNGCRFYKHPSVKVVTGSIEEAVAYADTLNALRSGHGVHAAIKTAVTALVLGRDPRAALREIVDHLDSRAAATLDGQSPAAANVLRRIAPELARPRLAVVASS